MKLVVGDDLQKTNIDNLNFPYLGNKQIADFSHKATSSATEQQDLQASCPLLIISML